MTDDRQAGEITRLLTNLDAGDPAAAEELLPIVYREMRALAGHFFNDKAPGHTLQPTIIVHDVFLRLAGKTGIKWEGRSHFMAVAAKAMRDLLVDHARRRTAQKRGGGWQRVTLSGLTASGEDAPVSLLDLEDALVRLAEIDERQARIVELRLFAGLEVKQIAHVLDVSERTVKYDWRMARAWLSAALEDDPR